MPRLPVHAPRSAIASISPVGVTRLRAGVTLSPGHTYQPPRLDSPPPRETHSHQACRLSAKTRQRREHDDDLEGRGAAYVSTFRWGRVGRRSSTAGIDYVSTFHGEGSDRDLVAERAEGTGVRARLPMGLSAAMTDGDLLRAGAPWGVRRSRGAALRASLRASPFPSLW
jgi:hypothetical protein